MSVVWKVLVGALVTLPMAAYIAGTVVGPPAPSAPEVSGTTPTTTPTQARSTSTPPADRPTVAGVQTQVATGGQGDERVTGRAARPQPLRPAEKISSSGPSSAAPTSTPTPDVVETSPEPSVTASSEPAEPTPSETPEETTAPSPDAPSSSATADPSGTPAS